MVNEHTEADRKKKRYDDDDDDNTMDLAASSHSRPMHIARYQRKTTAKLRFPLHPDVVPYAQDVVQIDTLGFAQPRGSFFSHI